MGYAICFWAANPRTSTSLPTPARSRCVRRFRNCRLIGRRFRLAHVQFGSEIIEVATFRAGQDADVSENHQTDEGMLLRDNVYGTIEQDALRRDFTVNALYYNISDFSIIDYAGGVEDLQQGLLRLLGDPRQGIARTRCVCCARCDLPQSWDFAWHPEPGADPCAGIAVGGRPLGAPVRGGVETVSRWYRGRVFREAASSMACSPSCSRIRMPALRDWSTSSVDAGAQGLENTDNRIHEDKPVTPAFLFAVLLWEPVRLRGAVAGGRGGPYQAVQRAGGEVVARQVQRIALPRRFSTPMQEIWGLQSRFLQTRGKRPQRLLTHPRFRAAYDFLLLRARSGEADPELASW